MDDFDQALEANPFLAELWERMERHSRMLRRDALFQRLMSIILMLAVGANLYAVIQNLLRP